MRLMQIIEQHESHAARAEEILTLASSDGAVVRSGVTADEQSMVLRVAQVHATLALYWQGEARDAREMLGDS